MRCMPAIAPPNNPAIDATFTMLPPLLQHLTPKLLASRNAPPGSLQHPRKSATPSSRGVMKLIRVASPAPSTRPQRFLTARSADHHALIEISPTTLSHRACERTAVSVARKTAHPSATTHSPPPPAPPPCAGNPCAAPVITHLHLVILVTKF